MTSSIFGLPLSSSSIASTSINFINAAGLCALVSFKARLIAFTLFVLASSASASALYLSYSACNLSSASFCSALVFASAFIFSSCASAFCNRSFRLSRSCVIVSKADLSSLSSFPRKAKTDLACSSVNPSLSSSSVVNAICTSLVLFRWTTPTEKQNIIYYFSLLWMEWDFLRF